MAASLPHTGGAAYSEKTRGLFALLEGRHGLRAPYRPSF